MKNISRLHYITQGDISGASHAELAAQACLGGIKWIQLRLKEETEEVKLRLALQVQEICKKHHAKLIINDHVMLAKEIKSDGIHLGKTDMQIPEARQLLGPDIIYGGTANNFTDIKKLHTWNADYIGIGPFKFTSTKKKLSPILGTDGYTKVVNQCKANKIDTPLIAIGGIQLGDISLLHSLGLYGIAIASPINLSSSPEKTAHEFIKTTERVF